MVDQKPILPDAIFLDTNALKQLYEGSASIQFLEIQNNAKKIGARIIAPEVAIKEWLNLRIRDAHVEISRIKTAFHNLSKMLGNDSLTFNEPAKIEQSIERNMQEFLKNAHVEVIPTPTNIELKCLIDMAVTYKAPFEEGDRGFKDAIILQTLTDYSLKNKFKKIILISGDHVFLDSQLAQDLKEAKLSLSVATNIIEAKALLQTQIKDFIDASIKSEAEGIKVFLDSKFGDIANDILAKADVSKDFVEGRWEQLWDPKKYTLPGKIKKINAVKPTEISYVFPGVVGLEEPKDASYKYTTFSVNIELAVVVEKYSSALFDPQKPKFPLSEPEMYEKMKDPVIKREEEQLTVTRSVTVEAKIRVIDGNFTDLAILNIRAI